MKIVTINPPGKLSRYYSGIAESSRGVRYLWVSLVNESVRSVFREESGGYWAEIPPSPELVEIIRNAVTKAAEAIPRLSRRETLLELKEGALFWSGD